MIPGNIKIVRKDEALTKEKTIELIKLNPSWILMGSKEIMVFFIEKNAVGAYSVAKSKVVEIMDACDESGYNRYHGYWPALHKRGMKAVGVPKVIEYLCGKSRVEITYLAKDGEVSVRVVRNWRIESEKMIGFCEKAKAERSFFLHSIYELREMPEIKTEEDKSMTKEEMEDLYWATADATEEVSKAKWLKEASETIKELEAKLAALKAELAKHAA